jgi:hypothetical protein
MVTLQPVESNMISAAGYDPERQYLLVLFNTGKAYEYYEVPPNEYDGLMAAESKGGYMREHILDQYPYAPFRGWKKQTLHVPKTE